MFRTRYECRKDSNGTWSVFDTFTSRVCNVGGREVHLLSERDARDILEILNGGDQEVTQLR